jgi:hypothetical protein
MMPHFSIRASCDVMDYTTDGGGGGNWAAAASVTNDIVLEQHETIYDGDDNLRCLLDAL